MAMILRDKYQGKEWFLKATDYLSSRLTSVESRLITTFRYVDLHTENRSVFSYEFASILRDLGSTFGSVADILARGIITRLSNIKETNFSHYREFLLNEVPDIHNLTICIRPLHPAGIIVPFEDMKTEKDTPKWWSSYNRIKHIDYNEYRVGNLENCVTALSALVLLGYLMGIFLSDSLFVNVGIAYSPNSIDMSAERRLFTT